MSDAVMVPSIDYEVWQNGDMVASASDLSDAQHYMTLYGQDGPVEAWTNFSYQVPGFTTVPPLAASTPVGGCGHTPGYRNGPHKTCSLCGQAHWSPEMPSSASPPPSVSINNGSRPQEAVPTEGPDAAVVAGEMEGESVALMRPFWVSWWGVPGTFEIHRPWWVSGERDDGMQSICAAVLAPDEFSARLSVQWAMDDKEAVIEWRFCEPKERGWSPFGSRFRRADWMRWPDAILSIIQSEEDKKRVAELLETNTRYLLRARKSEELLQTLIDKSMGHIHTRHLTDAQEHLKDPWA